LNIHDQVHLQSSGFVISDMTRIRLCNAFVNDILLNNAFQVLKRMMFETKRGRAGGDYY